MPEAILIGIPASYACRYGITGGTTTWGRSIHFGTCQYADIPWEDASELRNNLRYRILARIGVGATGSPVELIPGHIYRVRPDLAGQWHRLSRYKLIGRPIVPTGTIANGRHRSPLRSISVARRSRSSWNDGLAPSTESAPRLVGVRKREADLQEREPTLAGRDGEVHRSWVRKDRNPNLWPSPGRLEAVPT